MATGAGSSAEEASMAFKAPPDELKFLTPYLQRAHETRKADPALSYWCNFYAAQLGMTKLSALSPQAKAFLINLMDVLEAQKVDLGGNEIVHGGDLVARAHIENVALKVFAGADNEDRAGKASKATARRFLVACNFIDILTVFAPLEQDMLERQKYAKWKAADIGKAIREGRKPTPGPAGGIEEEQTDPTVTGLEAASSNLGNLHLDPNALPTTEELNAEMAKLAAQEDERAIHPVAITSDVDTNSDGIDRRDSGSSPARSRRAESRLSIDGRTGLDNLLDAHSNSSNPALNANSPNFSMPLRISRQGSYTSDEGANKPDTQSAFYHYTQGRVPSGEYANGAASPHARPLPQPPTPSHSQTDLSVHHSAHIAAASSYQTTSRPSEERTGYDTNKASFPGHGLPSAPPVLHSTNVPTAPPAPFASTVQTSLPSSLEVTQTARVQKLARWVLSALDYEDLDTARKHLREALDICEGRIAASNK